LRIGLRDFRVGLRTPTEDNIFKVCLVLAFLFVLLGRLGVVGRHYLYPHSFYEDVARLILTTLSGVLVFSCLVILPYRASRWFERPPFGTSPDLPRYRLVSTSSARL
jgi:hypothetical protein